ncbi:MAG: putative porin, partial [Bacteroidota bacterium]
FIYNTSSSFYLDTAKSFNKENTIRFFASYYNPALKLTLTGDYYLVSNYMYVTNYYKLQQESSIFNLLQVALHKTFRIGKHWYWYTDIYAQQKAGNVDLNVPVFLTRNRLALEGTFYKNLNIATGVEVRYNTAYKADSYSPVLGQFMYQDSLTIKNRPDIRLYLNFRIRSFKLLISASNLNAIKFSNGFGFTDNNSPAPGYAYPGLHLRFGIYWNFVN